MKFKYLYMPFNSGSAVTMESDCNTEWCTFTESMERKCRLIPAGKIVRIPADAPDGFPKEARDEVQNGRYFQRVTLRDARKAFGQRYLDELAEDCDISISAAEIPVAHWGKADEFENLVVEACENHIKTNCMVCPEDYSEAVLNALHYDPRFDVYHDDRGDCHYVELSKMHTKDGNPHTVTL